MEEENQIFKNQLKTLLCPSSKLDRSDGQFFKGMEWGWLFFSNDGMAMVFENSHHHHRWFLAGSTIGSDGFSNFGDQWFTMVSGRERFFTKNEIRDKMRVNEDLSETKHGMKSTSTQVDINQGTVKRHFLFSRNCHLFV